jgi:hypothetical protein
LTMPASANVRPTISTIDSERVMAAVPQTAVVAEVPSTDGDLVLVQEPSMVAGPPIW